MSNIKVRVRELAHSRAGDKGNTLSLSVIARNQEQFEHLQQYVTVEHCESVFAERQVLRIDRFILPRLQAMNFVIEGVLDGGVNRAIHRDRHGKTLSSLLLRVPRKRRTSCIDANIKTL